MFTRSEKLILSLSLGLALSACGQAQRFPYVPSGAQGVNIGNKNLAPKPTPAVENPLSGTDNPDQALETPAAQPAPTPALLGAADNANSTGLADPELKGPIPSPLVISAESAEDKQPSLDDSSKKVNPPVVKTPAPRPVPQSPVNPPAVAPTAVQENCGEVADGVKACAGDRAFYYDKANKRVILGNVESFEKNNVNIKIDRENGLMAALLASAGANSIQDTSPVPASQTHKIAADGYKDFKKGHVIAVTIAKGQRIAGEIDEIFEGGFATIKVNPLLGVGARTSSVYMVELKKASKQAASYGKFKVDDQVHYVWGDRLMGLDKSHRLEVVGRIAEIFENGQMIIDVNPTLLNGAQVYRLFWVDPGQMAQKVSTLKGFTVGDKVTYTFTKGQKFVISGQITEMYESGRAFIEVDPNVGDGAKVFHVFGADIKSMTHSK